ncbi:MAG: S8 family serine peptidase, partial [Methanosarcinales archaeon]|nr:S8 family serine peptidase [Methanosarcinales archaeon]
MGANKLVLIGLLAAMLILTSGCIDSGISSPGDAVKPITVGASDQYGHVAGFSSSGPTSDGRTKPTLVAPGVDIISCRAWET